MPAAWVIESGLFLVAASRSESAIVRTDEGDDLVERDQAAGVPFQTGESVVPSPQPIDHLLEGQTLDLVSILSAVQETAYLWDIATDFIEWESNACEVLGAESLRDIETGAAFQFLIAPEHITRRHEAIAGVDNATSTNGLAYRVQYRFVPGGRRSDASLWLEDHGRVWADADGKPVRARGVIRVINERYWEEQRLLYRSDHDELTGQLNRIRMTEALGALVTRAERTKQPCAFLMVSVNNLATINETFGFDIGDELIAATARVIRGRLRGGDTIGRYSSNKFGVILNDCGPGAMRIAAERFMKAVREHSVITSATPLVATISVGGVLIPDQATSVHQAISHALQALDRAKHKRFDSFMSYEPTPNQETNRRRNIAVADELIAALDQNRMLLALQPIVSTRTREIRFYECLLRIERPDGSIISAGEFIPVAEQLGLSRLIDRRTLELAIDLLKKHPTLHLTLNVSGLTADNHEWLVALHRLTGGRREITQRLVIEITETSAVTDIDQTIAFVDTLKEFGCRVAIDDFGAGFTSFKNLKLLDVDMVKIDGAFIRNLATDGQDIIFIKTLRDLAANFGMETVGEWVTDDKSIEILRDLGITYMQGFHCGKPVLARDLSPANVMARQSS
jgi:diguanylate cyclase (GGDEF)-like protein